mmetsp:Transcript_34920/g.84985  ORF Transcript_34920/g.84985 Transcript_34920/m.84985 type:complete len:228 (+) Transcript_34920:1612-2295(+)
MIAFALFSNASTSACSLASASSTFLHGPASRTPPRPSMTSWLATRSVPRSTAVRASPSSAFLWAPLTSPERSLTTLQPRSSQPWTPSTPSPTAASTCRSCFSASTSAPSTTSATFPPGYPFPSRTRVTQPSSTQSRATSASPTTGVTTPTTAAPPSSSAWASSKAAQVSPQASCASIPPSSPPPPPPFSPAAKPLFATTLTGTSWVSTTPPLRGTLSSGDSICAGKR